jgi:hypothetical protein
MMTGAAVSFMFMFSFGFLACVHIQRAFYEDHCLKTGTETVHLILKGLILMSYFDRAWHVMVDSIKRAIAAAKDAAANDAAAVVAAAAADSRV